MSRKNISLNSEIERRAAELIQLRGYSGLSHLLDALIREEHERRFTASALHDQPIKTDLPKEMSTSYRKGKKKS